MKLAQSLRMLSICLGVASEFKSSILLTASCDASLLWSTSTACKSLFVSLLRDSKRFEQWEEEVLFSFEIKNLVSSAIEVTRYVLNSFFKSSFKVAWNFSRWLQSCVVLPALDASLQKASA